jgi:hypothetical protein
MTTPILAQHSLTVFNKLESEAVDGTFNGSLTKLYDQCGISRSFYRRIFAILIDLSCITVVERGHGATLSKVEIHREPTEEEILAWDLTRGAHSDKTLLESRIKALELQIGGFNIKSAMQEVGTRLDQLDKRLNQLDRKPEQGER